MTSDVERGHVDVTVVVPTRNGAGTLPPQLDALVAQETTATFEIVVVDNGSTDETAQVVAAMSARDPRVRCVSEPVPGLNRARNTGTRAARGEVVLLCDCDDVVRPGWLDALWRAARDAGTAGGVLALDAINSTATLQMWGASSTIVPGEPTYGFLPAPYGACCGYRVDVWKQLGGFDESFSLGGDDFELFWRAQLAGYRFTVAHDAVVDYRLRSTPRAMWLRQYRFGTANVHTYAVFGDRGVARSSTGEALRAWGWILLNALPAAVSARRRHVWTRATAKRAGRIVGSLTERTLYL